MSETYITYSRAYNHYVTISDIATMFNGSITGSTFYLPMIDQSLDTGFVQKIVDLSESFLRESIDDKWDNPPDSKTKNTIISMTHNYCAFRLCAVLIGGVITRGFDIVVPSVTLNRKYYEALVTMTNSFKEESFRLFQSLHPLSLSTDSVTPSTSDLSIGQTSPSVM